MSQFSEVPTMGTEAFFQNPYQYYAFVQATAPVYWEDSLGSWLVTKYKDCVDHMGSSAFSVKRSKIDRMSPEDQEELHDLKEFYFGWLMFSDPPEHTLKKQSIMRAISRFSFHDLDVSIQEKAESLIVDITKPGFHELVTEYSIPLSIYAISQLIGTPVEDYGKIHTWSSEIVSFLGKVKPSLDDGKKALNNLYEIQNYLNHFILDQKEQGSSGIISFLFDPKERNEDSISENSLLSIIANVLIDGHEPIAAAITSAIFIFLENPSIQTLLSSNPELVPNAVEEILRLEPPFQYAARIAVRDLEIGGKKIYKGQRVMFMVAAANRDPDMFTNPHQFLIDRKDNPHLSFGHGRHFCAGARLARSVLNISLLAFLRLGGNIALSRDKTISWSQSVGYRRIQSLATINL
jgi:pimeloyl-[acyl-carrier protein] synthase